VRGNPNGDTAMVTELAVRVQPRASANGVTGWRGETLCLRVTAPPVEGAANRACQQLLADLLGLKRAQVTLVAGESARDKRFRIAGLTFEQIQAKIKPTDNA
jgi:uncharacterized protein